VLFEKKYVSLKYDIFRCFDRAVIVPDEGLNLGAEGGPAKAFSANDEGRSGPLFDAAENKPIRKPDPDLRTLRRQISFGSGSGFGSLKKKPTNQEHEIGLLSPPPGKGSLRIRRTLTEQLYISWQ
jgi:hypothetical protein